MNILSIPSSDSLSAIPIERLKDSKVIPEEQKLAEVTRQFEAVLLRQILQQARKTVFDSELNQETTASAIYDDMVTTQLADEISRARTFGLAKVLQAQLAREGAGETPLPADSTAPIPPKP